MHWKIITEKWHSIYSILNSKLSDTNKFGDTPAMFFSYYPYYGEDRDEKLEYLLKLIKVDDPENRPAVRRKSQMEKDSDLLDAIGENNLEGVKRAIVAGASFYPDWEQDYMGDVMHRALNAGVSNSILKFLIEHGASAEDSNSNGTTALMRVAMSNDYSLAKYMIDKGAKINAQNMYNNTALIFAAKTGDLEMIKLLLEHGAEINKVGNEGTALDFAIENSHSQAVKLLESKGGKTKEELQGE